MFQATGAQPAPAHPPETPNHPPQSQAPPPPTPHPPTPSRAQGPCGPPNPRGLPNPSARNKRVHKGLVMGPPTTLYFFLVTQPKPPPLRVVVVGLCHGPPRPARTGRPTTPSPHPGECRGDTALGPGAKPKLKRTTASPKSPPRGYPRNRKEPRHPTPTAPEAGNERGRCRGCGV